MSTILNTLKKLEEEKSVLEQTRDIRGMVTQVETRPHSSQELQKKSTGWIIFVTLSIICVGGAWRFLDLDVSSQRRVQVEVYGDITTDAETSAVKAPFKVSGIPMSGIPEDHSVVVPSKAFANKATVRKKTVFKKPVSGEELPAIIDGLNQYTNETRLSPEIQRIMETEPNAIPPVKVRELIQSATIQRSNELQSRNEGSVLSGQIPGLSIKGIIFFNRNNPANHIILATSANTRKKVKTGERVMGFFVESIESNQVTFLKNKKRVVVGMGG